MSESKRQEAINRQGERRDSDQPVQNNPFSSYMTNISHSPNERQPTRRRERQRSSSSQRSQRSKSREQRQREKRFQNVSTKQEPYDEKRGYQKKEYRGANYPPKKEQQKDQSYFKTKICPLYQKVNKEKMQGQCKKGSSCSFAHSQKEIRGLPNFRKTRLCIPFKNGLCPKASADCKYAHGEGEIRKLAYDYFPPKHHYFNRTQKYQRNDRIQRTQRTQRTQRNDRKYERVDRNDRNDRDGRGERQERGDRDKGYRDRPKDREGSKDRYKEHYHSKDYSRSHPSSAMNPNPQLYPPNLGPYIPNYNSAYMIPPSVGTFGQSGDLYPPPSASHPSAGSSANYAPSSSSVPPSTQGQSSYPPPLYNMGPSYEYAFGYLPHNYPPYNPSSV